MLLRMLKRMLRGYGIEVRRTSTLGWHPSNLRRWGFDPQTVVDVGVGKGTPSLYRAWPEAYHVLVEPLREFEPHLQRILKHYRGAYFLNAAGAKEETATIHVEATYALRSSFHVRTSLTATGDNVEKREVPVTTLDILLERNNFSPPFVLKIDTEGHEDQVIKGAPTFLCQTEGVIAEVSVRERFHLGYTFEEFLDLMRANHFCMCGVLNINPRGHLLDVVFCRNGDKATKRAES